MIIRRGTPARLRSLARFRLPATLPNADYCEKFARWMVLQGYHPITQQVYTRVIRTLLGFLRDKPVSKVNPRDILAFLAKFDNGQRSGSYLYNTLYTLRCFFDFLCLSGVVDSVAPRLIRFRKPPAQLPRVLSVSEVRRMLNRTIEMRDRALLEVLYATGCRGIEIARMRVEDVDFRNKEIKVEGKRSQRIVFFGDRAKKALLRYLDRRRQGIVFLDRYVPQRGFVAHVGMRWYACWLNYSHQGVCNTARHFLGPSAGDGAITKTEVQERFRKFIKTVHLKRQRHGLTTLTISKTVRLAGERVGIRNVSPRLLRSSFATHMLEKGADVHCVQRLLGHQNISATEAYLAVSNIHLAKTYRRYHPKAL